ncbi:uncharacterized protein LOC120663721 [Panicum virgatum]|uniref:uncharacterized protein LOC120663721 n=1 Tax=Panicum virgatum TaxID=38727 RepID=UPI0019D5BB0A|nr:uncharacterized protein LOC120663721 [Panicum virgatum]
MDQEQQVQEVTNLRGELEKQRAKHGKAVDLPQKKVEDLAKEKISLVEKNKFLQEKNKKMTKDHKDEVERLSKMRADADVQLVRSMQQIKDLAAERDLQELADLKTAVQAVVDMVDPIEGGEAGGKSLVERLREAPQKITGFLSETSRQYAAHVLGLVTSYWPGANSTPLGDGLSAKCSDEKFAKYLDEAKPVADKIV